jgi:hypothetical protein
MSDKTLWNPDKESDKVGWDLAAEDKHFQFCQNRTLWFGKLNHPVYLDWQNLVLLFEHLIILLVLDQNV